MTKRNTQLENDLQRLQLQQRNNQLALERLDEYEETISQLQEEIDQLRSNKKQPQTNENTNQLLIEERKRYEAISNLLEETRIQSEKFEQEKLLLQEQLKNGQLEFTKELNIREMLERQLIELNEAVQSLENENHELKQQLRIFQVKNKQNKKLFL